MAVILFALCIAIACTIGTGKIAEKKGRRFGIWAVVGFFLGIIGVVIAAVAPPAKQA